MINSRYVYKKLDAMTQTEIRFTALSPQFKLFLRAMQDDCNQQLTSLATENKKKLAADYSRIAMTREVYVDLLDFLNELTTEEGNKQ